MNDIKFRIQAESENATKTLVKARNFSFIVDEPEDLGGKNEGPNPVEYLLGAFAGCLNVMAHLIAQEMEFELRGVKINISGNLDPARLFGTSFEERAGYKGLEVKIVADCDADDATLDKWLAAVADRCPVSDNLKNITPVELKWKKK